MIVQKVSQNILIKDTCIINSVLSVMYFLFSSKITKHFLYSDEIWVDDFWFLKHYKRVYAFFLSWLIEGRYFEASQFNPFHVFSVGVFVTLWENKIQNRSPNELYHLLLWNSSEKNQVQFLNIIPIDNYFWNAHTMLVGATLLRWNFFKPLWQQNCPEATQKYIATLL